MTLLLPQPQTLSWRDGSCLLPESGFVVLNGVDNRALRLAGQQVCDALGWQLAAGALASATPTVQLNQVPHSMPQPEGYLLTIEAEGVTVSAETAQGVFYGVQTLRQLIQQHGHSLPCLHIRDWPDFANRGVMLDVSRDKVPTMETLLALVDRFASWKINQLQLYTEHTFAYRQHPTVWADASPITGEQILALDAYCRDRFIELVPNQNSFGHMRRWLTKPAYKHLAEAPDGCDTVWGWFDEPFTINPSDPESLELIRSLYDDLLPHFSSTQFNVGCDETVDLGGGHSKALVAEKGAGRVYLDFLLKIYQDVKRRGKTMQFWGDILMNHPELVPELPRDVIALEWGYEAHHDFAGHGAIFAASGIPFYVCPGTSSWRTVAGRTDNALENLRNAAENGLKHGAIGYLITDWGDEGHWQPLSASYAPFAYGSALAWAKDANWELDVAAVTDKFVYDDAAEIMGQLALDLGNIYQTLGIMQFNSTALFNVLQMENEHVQNLLNLEDETIVDRLSATMAALDDIFVRLGSAEVKGPDAALIKREFWWATALLEHACKRMLWVLDGNPAQATRLATGLRALIDIHDDIWHARNHSGGYRESRARFDKLLARYA